MTLKPTNFCSSADDVVSLASDDIKPQTPLHVEVAEGQLTTVDIVNDYELPVTWAELCCFNNLSDCFLLETETILAVPARSDNPSDDCEAVTQWLSYGNQSLDQELLTEELSSSGAFNSTTDVQWQVLRASLLYEMRTVSAEGSNYTTRGFLQDKCVAAACMCVHELCRDMDGTMCAFVCARPRGLVAGLGGWGGG